MLISYEGCGCAGGLVTTIQSELVPRDDTTGNARAPYMLQVWSSVLGASLTTVMPNGGKSGTKVFAGGAVIASHSTSAVGWTTADPVTGTVGSFGSGSGGGTEEFEPLGQTLHKQDPEAPPDPLPPDTMIGSADYPQWQCEEMNASWIWGGFHAWPVECQKRHMQQLTVTTYAWPSGKEGSVSGISRGLTDSPLPAGYSPGQKNGVAPAFLRCFSGVIACTVRPFGRGRIVGVVRGGGRWLSGGGGVAKRLVGGVFRVWI